MEPQRNGVNLYQPERLPVGLTVIEISIPDALPITTLEIPELPGDGMIRILPTVQEISEWTGYERRDCHSIRSVVNYPA